jgi:actin-related protein
MSFHDASYVKEKKCFVSNDYQHNLNEFNKPENAKKHQSEFQLPDGSMLQINDETFKAAEILFKPQLLSGLKSCEIGLHNLIA